MPNPTWISSHPHLRTKALNEPGLNSKMSSGGFSFPRFPFNEGRTSPVVPHTEKGKPWSRESPGAGKASEQGKPRSRTEVPRGAGAASPLLPPRSPSAAKPRLPQPGAASQCQPFRKCEKRKINRSREAPRPRSSEVQGENWNDRLCV